MGLGNARRIKIVKRPPLQHAKAPARSDWPLQLLHGGRLDETFGFTSKQYEKFLERNFYIQRNPAIAHFKGLDDFIPYCERCLTANIENQKKKHLGTKNICCYRQIFLIGGCLIARFLRTMIPMIRLLHSKILMVTSNYVFCGIRISQTIKTILSLFIQYSSIFICFIGKCMIYKKKIFI